MMVYFRKRLNLDLVRRINDQVVKGVKVSAQTPDLEQTSGTGEDKKNDEEGNEAALAPNQGQLIIDASCAPADIRYPTDLNLLNEARAATEDINTGLMTGLSVCLNRMCVRLCVGKQGPLLNLGPRFRPAVWRVGSFWTI
jgi:transposase, IS5 family